MLFHPKISYLNDSRGNNKRKRMQKIVMGLQSTFLLSVLCQY